MAAQGDDNEVLDDETWARGERYWRELVDEILDALAWIPHERVCWRERKRPPVQG